MFTRSICTISMLLVATSLSAGQVSTVQLIPVAAHTRGANGTFWTSDLVVFNPGAQPLTLEIAFVEAGEGLLDNVVVFGPRDGESWTVPARSSLRLSDILGDLSEGGETAGALIVGGDQEFILSSRTFTGAAAGGTFGQTVHPSTELIHDPGDALWLAGLSSSPLARTNIGVIAAADGATELVVEIRLLTEDGTSTGSRTITVPRAGINQIQISTSAIGTIPFDPGAAEIRILSGTGAVAAYGSIVDNVTGDAMFVSAAADAAPHTSSSRDRSNHFARFLGKETER